MCAGLGHDLLQSGKDHARYAVAKWTLLNRTSDNLSLLDLLGNKQA